MDQQIMERMLAMKAGITNDPRMLAQYTDKSFLFFEYETRMNHSKKLAADMPYKFEQTTSTGLRSSVPVQLTPANRVDIPTLARNTEKVLEGKYFLCRTLVPPTKMSAIMTIVEDPKGQQGVRLALYNYSSSNKEKLADLLQDLPVAQILAIKNPWFKSTQDGGFALRCDNPADVMVISELLSKELFPGVQWEGEVPRKWLEFIKSPPQSALEWKNEGNKLFIAQKYQKSVQWYTEGLNLKDDAGKSAEGTVMCDMLSNRAAAYLNLDCFQNALQDVNKLLEIDPNHIKGLYRKGKSFLGLQRYEEAITFLTAARNLKSLDSKNQKLFTELLKLSEILLKQQKTGEYDIPKLLSAGAVRHDDCADFVGPVEVKKIDGRGRGLVATQDIEPGQLISATKAFVVILPEPPQGQVQSVENEFNINFETNLINTASQRKLVQEIAQKLTLEPSLCRGVYQLYAGKHLPIYSDGDEHGNGDHMVDMKRIDAICTYNSFAGSISMETIKTDEDKLLKQSRETSGLWIFSSFFNHSCWDANALWTTFGDMLFVRAFKKIPQGEEILIPYQTPIVLYEHREEFLKKHGFVCECRLCQVDRDDSADGQKRAELLKKIDNLWKNKDDKNHDGEQAKHDLMMACFKNIMDFEKESQNPKLKIYPSLAYPLTDLAQHYFNPKTQDFKKSANLLTKCYDLTINSPLKEFAVQSCANLVAAYLMDGNVKEGKKWTETLKKEILIFYGTLGMAEVVGKDTLVLMEKFNITF